MISIIEIAKRPLRSIKHRIDARYFRYCVDHYPKKIIEEIWLRDFGYPIDWKHPRDINEKIQWLIVYSDTREWSRLADKYLVREYVKSKGFEANLTKLYGAWKHAEDIDFDSLPDKFVLKCNHDCGSYCIVDKCKGYDRNAIIRKLNACLMRKFGYNLCEPHYNKISPLVLAEEFLEDNSAFSSSLVDYKVWCFNGRPHSIFVCYGRDSNGKFTDFYDLSWNSHPEWLIFSERNKNGESRVSKPLCLAEMLEMASILSQGFPEVRIDFYIVNNHIFFGEMTFTDSSGKIRNYAPAILKEFGNLCDLSLAPKR